MVVALVVKLLSLLLETAARVYESILVPAATAVGSIVTVKSNVWVPFPKPLPVLESGAKAIVVADPDSPKVTVPEVTLRVKALKVLSPTVQLNPGPLTIATVSVAGQSAAFA
jgi:hypothetical protein